MGIVKFMGFDEMAAGADVLGRGWTVVTAGGLGIFTDTPFDEGRSLRDSGAGNHALSLEVDDEVCVGAFLKMNRGSATTDVFHITDSSGDIIFSYRAVVAGVTPDVQLVRGGTVVATLSHPSNIWKHVVLQYKRAAAGWFRCWLDQELVYEETGDTTSHASPDQLRIRGFGFGWSQIDDLWVTDGENLGFAVARVGAASDDVSTQWTPDSGSDNFARVNQVPHNSDSAYVRTETVGHTDRYEVSAPDVTNREILAVQPYAVGRTEALGDSRLKLTLHSAAEAVEKTTDVLNTVYRSFAGQASDQDPNTSAAWTPAGLDAVEVSIELTDGDPES